MLKSLTALAVILIGLTVLVQLLPTDPVVQKDREHAAAVGARAAEAPSRKEAKPMHSTVAHEPSSMTSGEGCTPPAVAVNDDGPIASSVGENVVARVIGSDGTPRAGVTVLFLSSYLDATSGTWPEATSDSRGLARISVPPSEGITLLKACAIIHGSEITPVKIKLPQQAPAQIVTPPTGSLEIELMGSDGRPWTWPTGLECRNTSFRIPLARGGRLLLRHVSPGCRFEFSDDGEQTYGIQTTSVCGPTIAGETVRRQITVVCHRPHLTGRVLDPEGCPVAEGLFGFQRVVSRDGKLMRGSIHLARATEGGRFLLALEEGWAYRKLRVQWRMHGKIRAFAELPLHGPYSRLRHQVGDVRLEPAVLLARGRVRAASGAPLRPGVWVEIHHDDGEHELDCVEKRLEDRPEGSFERTVDDPADDPTGLYHEAVDAGGRFEVRGAPLSSPFTLRARGGGYSGTVRPNTVPGAEDVEFVLSQAGRIPGRIQVSPGVNADDLRVSAFTVLGRLLRSDSLMNDGRFILFRMPVGFVNVAIFEPGADRPIVTIQNVRVTAGEDSDDKRLTNIDLRGAVRLMVLRVIDTSGRSIPGATTFGRKWRHDGRKTDANGEVRFLASEAPVPLVVRAPGFRPCRVSLLVSQTVTLKRSIPVRLFLDYGMQIPPGLTGQVYLNHEHARAPTSGTGNPAPVMKEFPLSARHVDLLAEAPGEHQVTIFFEPEEVCAMVDGQVVEIQDQADPQRFRIRFDPEKVRKALERVRTTLKTK